MHKEIHKQQSSSVTSALRNKKPQHFKSTRSTFRDQAIQRGIEEHSHFKKEVAYFYSANSRPESFFYSYFSFAGSTFNFSYFNFAFSIAIALSFATHPTMHFKAPLWAFLIPRNTIAWVRPFNPSNLPLIAI